MEVTSAKYVRTVLAVHLAILGLVIALVAFAATRIHASVRAQALMQARATQELLAKQTAAGVAAWYESIARLLELLAPVHGEPAADRGSLADLRARQGEAVWAQLKDRASILLIVDAKAGQVLERWGDASIDPKRLLDPARALLQASAEPVLGPFLRLEGIGSGHVICVPMRDAPGRVMVAFVPIDRVELTVLVDVGRQHAGGAMLIDSSGMILSDPNRRFVGLSVFSDFRDPRVGRLASEYMARGVVGTEIYEESARVDDAELKPAMLTISPVRVLGRQWSLVVRSNIDEVEGVVNHVFREALLWAVFVVVSMTAILVSTAVQMIRGRVRFVRLQHEMIEKELNQARRIQLAWLPKAGQKLPGIDVAAVNRPANHISGDFYNWFALEDGRVVVTIGDVTGHGMSAAFLMATTQLLVRQTMQRLADPARAMNEINRQLASQMFAGQFVTMLILLIDLETGRAEAVSAGHPPPLVRSKGRFSILPLDTQLVLGIETDVEYTTETIELPPDATLVMYTDGVLEVTDESEEQFGEAGLLAAVENQSGGPSELVDAVTEAINNHRQGKPLADDLTLVAVKLVGTESPTRHVPAARNATYEKSEK